MYENLGIGAVLTFNSAHAIAGMQRASKAFDRLRQNTARAKQGMAQMSGGAMKFGMAATGMSVVLGLGARKAAGFEQTMAGVSAITRVSGAELRMMSERAQDLAMETVFSASEVGKAMETMGRAGFSTAEILESVRSVLDTAAAEGMGMAEAADVIASNVRAFGLDAAEAGRVADVLALASSMANTNIMGLAEGLKYAAPIARGLGVTLEETTTALSLLADTGLKGSLAGTALKNSLIKMAKPSSEGAKIMAQMGLTVKDARGDFIGLEAVLMQLGTGINVFGGRVDRTAAAAELFGLRGVALTNLLTRLDKATAGGARTFGEFHKELTGATGAAGRMAETRLDTLGGAIKLIGSSLEVFWINVMEPFLVPLKESIREGIRLFNILIQAIRWVNTPMEDLATLTDYQREKFEQMTPMIRGMASGIMDALNTVKTSAKDALDWIGKLWERFGGGKMGEDAINRITKIATLVMLVVAAVGPLLLALTGLGFAFSGLSSMAGGFLMITKSLVAFIPLLVTYVTQFAAGAAASAGGLLAAFWPVALIVGTLALAFAAFRHEGESVTDTLKRLATMIKGGVKAAIEWLPRAWQTVVDTLRPIAVTVLSIVIGMFDKMKAMVQPFREFMIELFRQLGGIVSVIGEGIANVIAKVKPLLNDLRPAFNAVATIAGAVGAVLFKIGKVILPDVGAVAKFVFTGLFKMIEVGVKTISVLVRGITWAITKLVNWIGDKAIPKIQEWGASFKKWIQPGIDWLLGAVETIKKTFLGIGSAIWKGVQKPIRNMAGDLANLLDKLSGVADVLGLDITGTVAGLRAFAGGEGHIPKPPEFIGPLPPPAFIGPEPAGLARGVAQQAASQKALAAAMPAQEERCIQVQNDVTVDVPVKVDGRELAHVQARYQGEVRDRTGASLTPWQQRQLVVNANPIGL